MNILGPAKKLLRVRQQEARLKRVESGGGETARITIELGDDGRRIVLEIDRREWDELREKVDRAFVFDG